MRVTLWTAALAGCGWWVTGEEHLARVDADLDGVSADRDCDDADPTASEVAGVFRDGDGDGVGGADQSEECGVPDGFSALPGDCDDADPERSELAPVYPDADDDGYGAGQAVELCGVPDGYADVAGDCDDGEPGSFPGNPERCNGDDDDCNGVPDDGDPQPVAWFVDGDRDGWGRDGTEVVSCTPPDATVDRGGDCDDGDAGVNPGASETCSGVDDDCDGAVDADDPDMAGTATWYADADGDGWGDASDPGTEACSAPSADHVQGAGDCADADAERSPGAVEVCNAVDDDCDAAVDTEDPDLDAPLFYGDADGDGFGDLGRPVEACAAPQDFVDNADDCDDADDAVFPADSEITLATGGACGDARDNDCDGPVDNADDDCRDDDVDGAFNGLDPIVALDVDGDGDREALCVEAALVLPAEWASFDAFRAIRTTDVLGFVDTDEVFPADLDVLGALLPGSWCWDLSLVEPGTYVYDYESSRSASDPAALMTRTDCDTWKEADVDGYCAAFDDPYCGTPQQVHTCDPVLTPGRTLRVVWDGHLE